MSALADALVAAQSRAVAALDHHVVPRDMFGDDVADNIVPLCSIHHGLVTSRVPPVLVQLRLSLSDSERAYVVGKLGEDGLARLFGATR